MGAFSGSKGVVLVVNDDSLVRMVAAESFRTPVSRQSKSLTPTAPLPFSRPERTSE